MLFRLPIVKFFNRILNRITVTVVLVALQLAWLAWVFFALTTGTARVWVTGVLNGLSLLIILYLVRKDENSAYKVGWIALIGLLPLLGGALYLAFGNKRPSRRLRSKMQGCVLFSAFSRSASNAGYMASPQEKYRAVVFCHAG